MVKIPRALVADDEPIVLLFLHQILTGMGYEVVAVEDGTDLVERALQCNPDIIVTDVRMPGLDGVQACREICRQLDVPVVAITAHVDEYLARRMVEQCPVFMHTLKPVNEETLRGVIARAVARFGRYRMVLAEERLRESALQSWRMVEQAVARVMQERGVDEEAAFNRLRRHADEDHVGLRHAARAVLKNSDEL